MPKKKLDRYTIIRGRVNEKHPQLTDDEQHNLTKYLLAKTSQYGNWHHLPGMPNGWEFPIDQNLSIRLEPGSLDHSFYVSIHDKCYYNPSGDPDTHLAFLTDVKLPAAKLEAISLGARYLHNNTVHFQKAWDKLQHIAKTKNKPFRDIIKSCAI